MVGCLRTEPTVTSVLLERENVMVSTAVPMVSTSSTDGTAQSTNDTVVSRRPAASSTDGLKRVASWMLTLVMVALLVIASAAAFVPRLIGAQPLTVLSGSMVPTFNPGDLVIVRPFDVNTVAVGDVITFQPESGNPTLITHRVIDVTRDASDLTQVSRIVTQGDANNMADNPLVPEQVMGRMLYRIPYLGFLHDGPTYEYVGYAVGGGLIVYAIATLLKDPIKAALSRNTQDSATLKEPENDQA